MHPLLGDYVPSSTDRYAVRVFMLGKKEINSDVPHEPGTAYPLAVYCIQVIDTQPALILRGKFSFVHSAFAVYDGDLSTECDYGNKLNYCINKAAIENKKQTRINERMEKRLARFEKSRKAREEKYKKDLKKFLE